MAIPRGGECVQAISFCRPPVPKGSPPQLVDVLGPPLVNCFYQLQSPIEDCFNPLPTPPFASPFIPPPHSISSPRYPCIGSVRYTPKGPNSLAPSRTDHRSAKLSLPAPSTGRICLSSHRHVGNASSFPSLSLNSRMWSFRSHCSSGCYVGRFVLTFSSCPGCLFMVFNSRAPPASLRLLPGTKFPNRSFVAHPLVRFRMYGACILYGSTIVLGQMRGGGGFFERCLSFRVPPRAKNPDADWLFSLKATAFPRVTLFFSNKSTFSMYHYQLPQAS